MAATDSKMRNNEKALIVIKTNNLKMGIKEIREGTCLSNIRERIKNIQYSYNETITVTNI